MHRGELAIKMIAHHPRWHYRGVERFRSRGQLRPALRWLLVGTLFGPPLGCSDSPAPIDDGTSYEDWAQQYWAEDGMFCMIWKVCDPEFPCEDQTDQRIGQPICEGMFEPKYIDDCEAAYAAHLEQPACETSEILDLIRFCDRASPCSFAG